MGTKFDGATNPGSHWFPPEALHTIKRGINLRHFEEPEAEFLEFARSIARQGQLVPGNIRKNNLKEPELFAGNRRLNAILKINEDPSAFLDEHGQPLKGPMGFWAVYTSMTDEQALAANWDENDERKPLGPVDQAYAVQTLRRLGWDTKRISALTKIPPARISVLESFLTLPAGIITRFGCGKMKEATAKAFAGLDDEQVAARLADFDAGVKPAKVARDAKRAAGKVLPLSNSEIRAVLDADGCDQALAFSAWACGKGDYEAIRLGDFPPVEIGTASDTEPRVFVCTNCLTEAVTSEECESCGSPSILSKAAVLRALESRELVAA